MRKFRSKWIAILATLALLATLLVPMVGPAAASSTYTALTVPSVPDGERSTLGTVLIHTTAGSISANHMVIFRLPTDYEFDWKSDDNQNGTLEVDNNNKIVNIGNLISVPESYSGDPNGFKNAQFEAYKLADNEIKLVVSAVDEVYSKSNDGYLYVNLNNVWIPDGESGELKLVIDAPSTSGFSKGEVVVAKISTGYVIVSVDEVKSFSDEATVVLRFKESVKGAFERDNESIKLRLPNGFEWKSVGTPTLVWGDKNWLENPGPNTYEFKPDGRDLYLRIYGLPSKGMYFSIPVTIAIEDESVAKEGDVAVTISGATDTNPTSLVVAKYGEMGANVSAKETPNVIAGKTEQKIGDIVIEETAPGSLAEGRTITLTLPSFAKWGKLPSVETENNIKIDTDKGYNGFATVSDDGRTLKFWIKQESKNEAGKITLEDAEVILSGDAKGDLVIKVGGTAGINKEVTVAKVVPPVTLKAASVTEVKIGMNDQLAGDIEIVESIAGAIENDENIEVWLPAGVSFSSEPKVEVTSGDLEIDENNVKLTEDDSKLIIPVEAESTSPSTIKISGIKYDIYRSVPEGEVKIKVGGLALNEVNDQDTLDKYYSYNSSSQQKEDYYVFGPGSGKEQVVFARKADGAFPGVEEVASVVNAKVITPAPVEKKATAVFKVGDTKYTLNGVEQTMDVAPYVKNDRTYLPVRYVAQALGVAPENIYYADGVVTLIKGSTAVQLTIGSNVMKINGAEIKMDVPAELSNGRTMLPFRWVAQALGASVQWDEATQTVTMTL